VGNESPPRMGDVSGYVSELKRKVNSIFTNRGKGGANTHAKGVTPFGMHAGKKETVNGGHDSTR